jgi:hypothetical protein
MYGILSQKRIPERRAIRLQSPDNHLFFIAPCITCRPAVKNPLCVLLEKRQPTAESRVVVSLDTNVTSRIGAIPLNDEIAVKLLGSLSRDLRLQ